MKYSFFSKRSVAANLELGHFDTLTDQQKKDVLNLISRISEKSYRRGFQHGAEFNKKVNPSHFRYKVSLNWSPYTDTFHKSGKWASKSGLPLIERLFIEYPELNNLGFFIPVFNAKPNGEIHD